MPPWIAPRRRPDPQSLTIGPSDSRERRALLAIFRSRARGMVASLIVLILMAGDAVAGDAPPLESGISRGQVENRTYLSYVTESLDNLITFGTDRYGPVQSSLFVSILDVRTKATVIPEFGDTNWRADTRFERRSPQGANFLQTQPLIRTLYRVSDITGDDDYARFAFTNIHYATNNLVDGNGMFHWGWHRWYDVVTDEFKNDGDVHEMHFVTVPQWERMWAVNPSAVQTEIQQIWNRHVVDKSTGQINRHDSGGTGVSFIMTSASFIEATAFLSTKVGGPIPGETDPSIDTWIERSKRIASYPYDNRDPTTNLVPHIPFHASHADREDQFTAFTTMHLLALGLLKAHEHTGDNEFRDQAMTYLTAYDFYGYDSAAETYWSTLNIADGSPDTSPRSGPLQAFPTGHIDFWQPNVIDREFPAEAAQAYADAFALTGDATMKTAAERWAKIIRNTQEKKGTLEVSIYSEYSNEWAPLGTYAEHYGRVIDFFLTMYDETSEDLYLFSARDMAKDAVSSLYFEGLFRGHPNKPYYEELDGVPLLLESLAELDQHVASFTKFGDFDGNDVVDLVDYQTIQDHWLSDVSPYQDGDVTGDGFVSLVDFSRFKNEYFEGLPAALGDGLGSIPEPRAVWLVVVGLALVVSLRRTRSRRVALQQASYH